MKLDDANVMRRSVALLTGVFGLSSIALAQPFTDMIKISSKFGTLQAAIDATGPGGC